VGNTLPLHQIDVPVSGLLALRYRVAVNPKPGLPFN
jgi:hypothetical protein